MKTKTLVILVAAVTVVIAAAVRTTKRNAVTAAELAAVASQRDEMRMAIISLQERLQATRQGNATMEKEAASMSEQGGAVASAGFQSPVQPDPPKRRLSPTSLIANDPQKMAEYAKNFRESLDLTLGGMFKVLRLSPEQIGQVKDLKVWFEQSRIDLEAVAEAEGLEMRGEAYRKLRQDLENERVKREAALFGPPGLEADYRRYYRLQYLRDTVQRLGSSEMYPEAPATLVQIERAIDIVAANSQRPPNGFWSWQYWTTINWDAAGPQLQTVLSSAQLAELRVTLRREEAHTRVAARNVAIQGEARRLSREPGR